jgi:hypothetical protein
MLKPFTAQIESALIDRTNEIEEQLLMPDEHYQQLNAKINDTLDQIGQTLPPGKEQLITDLDRFYLERDMLAYRHMYRQGLLDGMEMKRLIKIVIENYKIT